MDTEEHSLGPLQDFKTDLVEKNNIIQNNITPYKNIQQHIISIFTRNVIDHKYSLYDTKISTQKYYSSLWLHSTFSQLLCLTLHEVFEPYMQPSNTNINTHTQLPLSTLLTSPIYVYQSPTIFYDNHSIHLLSSIRIYKLHPYYKIYKQLFKQTLISALISHLQSSLSGLQGFPPTIHVTHDITFTRVKGEYLDIDPTTLSLNNINQLHKPRHKHKQTVVLVNELTNYAKELRYKHNRLIVSLTTPLSSTDDTQHDILVRKVVDLESKIDMMTINDNNKDKEIERLTQDNITQRQEIDRLRSIVNGKLLPPLLQAEQVSITNSSLIKPMYPYMIEAEALTPNLGSSQEVAVSLDELPPFPTSLSDSDSHSHSRLSGITIHSSSDPPTTPVPSPEVSQLSPEVSSGGAISSSSKKVPLSPKRQRVISRLTGKVVGNKDVADGPKVNR